MKQQVQVVWNFVPKPEPVPMITLKNGQQIALGVEHDLRPEGIPTERVWCTGCKIYFPSWHHALWRHGLCQQKPGGKMPEVQVKVPVAEPPKKNDRVAFPKDFADWSLERMKVWLKKHRPENYAKIYGRSI